MFRLVFCFGILLTIEGAIPETELSVGKLIFIVNIASYNVNVGLCLYSPRRLANNYTVTVILEQKQRNTQAKLSKLIRIKSNKKISIMNKKTRCVAMPSVMAARWVGQNSSPIFVVCRPKYT